MGHGRPWTRGADSWTAQRNIVIPNTTAHPRRVGISLAALLTLTLLFTGFVLPATVAGSTTYVAACSDVSLRTAAKTGATRKALIPSGTRVRVVATVEGGSYSANCGGSVSGAKW